MMVTSTYKQLRNNRFQLVAEAVISFCFENKI